MHQVAEPRVLHSNALTVALNTDGKCFFWPSSVNLSITKRKKGSETTWMQSPRVWTLCLPLVVTGSTGHGGSLVERIISMDNQEGIETSGPAVIRVKDEELTI